jgi:1-acyl-sn-glycerol-3-phosphate acyltransferase
MLSLFLSALRSALFTLIFYPGTVIVVILCALAGLFGSGPLRTMVRGWGFFHRFCCRWILGQRIVIKGTIPKQAMLIVSKHESMFETIDFLCVFRSPAIAAKQELLNIPGWGWIARRYGLIGIQREAGTKALRFLQKQALASVAEGRPVAIFPEGTRVPHGTRAPIRAGFAALYQLLKLPVLPIAIDSGRLSPRHSFLKKPGVITYKIGEVIPAGLPRDEAEALAMKAINALND